MCRESVANFITKPQRNVHSLSSQSNRECFYVDLTAHKQQSKALFLMMEISTSRIKFFTFSTLAPLLHFIKICLRTLLEVECNKTAIHELQIEYLERSLNGLRVDNTSRCTSGLNYIIDDRWGLWLCRKWKHGSWYQALRISWLRLSNMWAVHGKANNEVQIHPSISQSSE